MIRLTVITLSGVYCTNTNKWWIGRLLFWPKKHQKCDREPKFFERKKLKFWLLLMNEDTLLTAPRELAHWVDESRSTCSSCRRHKAARVNHSDGVLRQSLGLRWSSSSLVSVRTASAMLAFVTSAHSFDKTP